MTCGTHSPPKPGTRDHLLVEAFHRILRDHAGEAPYDFQMVVIPTDRIQQKYLGKKIKVDFLGADEGFSGVVERIEPINEYGVYRVVVDWGYEFEVDTMMDTITVVDE